MSWRKNMIQIAVIIQIVIAGVAIYKLFDAEAFRVYPNPGSPLHSIRTEARAEETKSIITSTIIQSCMLWGIAYLIKPQKNKINK